MKYIFYYILLLSFNFSQSQQTKIEVIKLDSINFKANSFYGVDGFKNYYYANNNVFFKKSEVATFQYQNLSLGNLTKVDVSNPLKIILFYEEFNSVVVLDNQLNEIQKIEFSNLENPIIASSIGIAAQNQLWVYNTLNQQIGLFDLNTATYKNLGVPIKETFNYYQTDFNYFNWIDSKNQWITTSIYGRITNNGTVEVNENLQLLEANKILFSKENKLYIRDRNVDKLYKIEIVEKSFHNFFYKDQILSIFTEYGITNYKIILP